VLIGQALTLRYKPVNLDVLPLYITLVLAAPLILWCLTRRANLTLLGSAVLYVAARGSTGISHRIRPGRPGTSIRSRGS